MTWSLLQETQTATTGGTYNSTSAIFPSSTTSGSLGIAICAGWGASQSCTSVTDNKGNTWTKIGTTNRSPGNDTLDVYYCANMTGGASHQVTANWSQTDNVGLLIMEFSGAAISSVLNQSNTTATGTGTTSTSNSITPETDNQLIVVAGTDQRLDATEVGYGSGYTKVGFTGNANNSVRVYAEYKVLTTGAPTTGDFSIGSSVTWAASIMSFIPATSSTPSNQYLTMMGVG